MASTEDQDITPSLFETLRSSELTEIVQDLGEIALDQVLDDDLVKEVPIIGTIVRLGKATITIRDRFLIKKLLKFLEGLNEISQEQREEFSIKLEKDSQFQKRVGEFLIMLLDRYDHVDKPHLMSKIFSAYIREEINFDEFQRLSIAIDRAFMKDLKDLLNYYSGEEWPHSSLAEQLYASGMSSLTVNAQVDREFNVVTTDTSSSKQLLIYSFNPEAEKFARIILGDEFSPEKLLQDFLKNQ